MKVGFFKQLVDPCIYSACLKRFCNGGKVIGKFFLSPEDFAVLFFIIYSEEGIMEIINNIRFKNLFLFMLN